MSSEPSGGPAGRIPVGAPGAPPHRPAAAPPAAPPPAPDSEPDEGPDEASDEASDGVPSGPPPRARGRTGRLVQLYAGLALYGVSSALLVEAGLGLEPWGVLHQGLSRLTGISLGNMSIVVGAVVLLLWVPLRERPGLGTVSNVVVVGLAIDASLAVLPEAHRLAVRVPLLAVAVLLNALATGLYIAAGHGPGPRDGLMTGLHRRTGRSIRLARTCVEVTVVATGFALGGTVGVGTLVYALAIGPLAQVFLRAFGGRPAPARHPALAKGSP